MKEAAIEARNLVLKRAGTLVFNRLSLTVGRGRIFTLPGESKTSGNLLCAMLAGNCKMDSGELRLCGADLYSHPARSKETVAMVTSKCAVPLWMSPTAAMRLGQAFFAGWQQDYSLHLLENYNLPAERPLGELPREDRILFSLIYALSRRVKLLILAEPADDLAETPRKKFLDLLLDHLHEEDCAVFSATNLLEEFEGISDRVGILRDGTLCLEEEWPLLREECFLCSALQSVDFPGMKLLARRKENNGWRFLVRGDACTLSGLPLREFHTPSLRDFYRELAAPETEPELKN